MTEEEKLKIIEDWLSTFPCDKFWPKEKKEVGSCIREHIDPEDILLIIEEGRIT